MKIGVFDSGIGGISILNELIKHYPMFNYVYIADYKNNPYGTKRYEEIELITKENINKLINMDVDLIVIACNTASIASYNIKSNIKIIRITDLIIKEALKESNIDNVYLYATNLIVNNV